MAFEIAKAGWLMRESSFLKRWKKNWFILYRDGLFKYFDDDHSSSAEEVVIMRTQCQKINDGLNVTDVSPPAGYSNGCLLKLKLTDGTWNLCADSPDDMSAWKFALEEARYVQPAPRVTSTRTTTVVNAGYPVAPGTTTVYQVPTQPGTTQYEKEQNEKGQEALPEEEAEKLPEESADTAVMFAQDSDSDCCECCDGCFPPQEHRVLKGQDLTTAMVAGAALGPMMIGPVLWW